MHSNRSFLTRFAWLSIAAALATIGLKALAYWLTGSVGLLSDALEAGVNLVGAIAALVVLIVAARPADEEHAFGHSKAEYFSSGLEGGLIFFAGLSIAYAALRRLVAPQPLEQIGLGLALSLVASLINLGVALLIRRAARQHESVTLEANAQHLLSDVWTSAGVLVGVGLVSLTGWQLLDPLIALLVAANIGWAGVRLTRSSALGLMDTALPDKEVRQVEAVLDRYRQEGIHFHALRSRQAAARRFVSFHVLVPGDWSVRQGHRRLEQIEADIRNTLDNVTVFTHLEAIEDEASFADQSLDREDA